MVNNEAEKAVTELVRLGALRAGAYTDVYNVVKRAIEDAVEAARECEMRRQRSWEASRKMY